MRSSYIYLWPNGDRSILFDCQSIDHALDTLDEIDDAESRRLIRIKNFRAKAIHFAKVVDEDGEVQYEFQSLGEYLRDELYDKKLAPKKTGNNLTSGDVIVKAAYRRIGRQS